MASPSGRTGKNQRRRCSMGGPKRWGHRPMDREWRALAGVNPMDGSRRRVGAVFGFSAMAI
jgi:hypothetical protein